ncbi:hypothetical protein ADIS_4726 [Lunatimonas lonarensis]|uniref:Uncharacterized protein n=1 Tax=Lunatimonas lonarensis TaxID=1232681 RepID=R7ZL56_9BACT|nr:hypothetical protein ADIS_4726 [Lunatimonas lonarensis]
MQFPSLNRQKNNMEFVIAGITVALAIGLIYIIIRKVFD